MKKSGWLWTLLSMSVLISSACSGSGDDDDDDDASFDGDDDDDDTDAGDDDGDDDFIDDDADDDIVDDDAADDDATDDDVVDDDATDDDVVDDDATDDDVDDDYPCEGEFDAIVEGQTDFPGGSTGPWVLKIRIGANHDLQGKIMPDTMPEYDVFGAMTDLTNGWLEGAFPTPPPFLPYCQTGMVANHDDFNVENGGYRGNVSFYCGEINDQNYITSGQSHGEVTCGSFEN